MATKILRTAKRTVTLDARPDRPDLRDRIYQPPLVSLPHQYPPPEWIKIYLPRYSKAGLILDQGEEGACTGFGLAAVINYLLFRQFVHAKAPPSPTVSTRMIYHLARKYDEWPGEDYEGSSCRGAMKGWFHHGVCSDKLWPYRDKNGERQVRPARPQMGRRRRAAPARRLLPDHEGLDHRSPGGHQRGRRRVRVVRRAPGLGFHREHEVGDPDDPVEDRDGPGRWPRVRPRRLRRERFIVQNSWGEDWGFHGFARVTYDDWLTNGDDAWVAVMGAPIAARAPAIMLASLRTLSPSDAHLGAGLANGATAAVVAEPPRPNAWNTETAVNHTVILGNDGLPDHITLEDADAAAAVDRICYELPKAWLKNPKNGGRRIAVYAHGGLNDLTASLDRAKVMGPWFEQNGIYPVFIAWQSGVADTIENIIRDFIGSLVSEAPDRKTRSLVDTASEARDYLIEAAAIVPARPIWSQMKQNAVAASSGNGGMVALAGCLARLGRDYSNLEVHLVGHSAGAILLGAFLGQLAGNGLTARTVSLYAPACTVAFANSTYLPAAENKIIDPKRVVCDVLSNSNELDDTVGPYGKSLLYLVSRALEPTHKTPILGMEATWEPKLDKEGMFVAPAPGRPNPDVAFWRKSWLKLSDDAQSAGERSAWSRSSRRSPSGRCTAASTTGSKASRRRSRASSACRRPASCPCESSRSEASRSGRETSTGHPSTATTTTRANGDSDPGRRRAGQERRRRGRFDATRRLLRRLAPLASGTAPRASSPGGAGGPRPCAGSLGASSHRPTASGGTPASPWTERVAADAWGPGGPSVGASGRLSPPSRRRPLPAAATGTPKTAFACSQNSRLSASPFRPPLIRRVIVTKSPASASALRPFRAQNHAAARHPGPGVAKRSGSPTRSTPMADPHAR